MESAAQFIPILSKFGQLVVDEVQEIRGVGDKVVHIMDELSTMNAVLRMLSEADQSFVDHLMREWEKQVRELAYDAEDCADTYWLRINVSRRDPLLRYIVKWPKYQLEKVLLQRALAADVKALLARTIAVSERRVRYGIDRAALPRSPWFAPVSRLPASADALRRVDDPDDQFVGIEEQVKTLADRIKAVHAEDDRKLKVFSIVGFGGLGKTTLAVELCRHLDADFQRQALVSVSQAFYAERDMKGLLARLLQQIVEVKEEDDRQNPTAEEAAGTSTTTHGNQPKTIDQMDVEVLSIKLKELLVEKRYLIVIDDVWNLTTWEAIRVRLPENNCSSRIILTTRIETVAKASSVLEDLVHHMKPLELKDSEKLFVKKAFGSTGGTCPDGLNDVMGKILKKCGGLPLAIVSIASLLASYNSVESTEMWIRVSNSIGSQMENYPTLEGMRQVITLSYNYLPHHLKACMMYLSIFPEDYVIAKNRLLYRWIAEGLVAEKRGLTSFHVAQEYFSELVSRNMIQLDKLVVTKNRFYWSHEEMVEEACRVHDMMLEVMVSKSQEANFVRLVGQQYEGRLPHGKVRRLSIHGNGEEHSSAKEEKAAQRHRAGHGGGIEMMNVQHVRSLTTFQLEGLDKLLDRLGDFKLLRVLDLEDCRALKNKHMRDVCRLYLLRYLGLRGTKISVMPREIGCLEYLESLDVENTFIRDVPQTVTKLSKLERLRAPWWTLPLGLGNMKALHEVDWAELKDHAQIAQEIGELQQLQVLCIRVKDFPADGGSSLSKNLSSSLSKTRRLRSLHVKGDSLMFLQNISSPPPLLRCLTMEGPFFTAGFPEWVSSLKHLTELTMRYTQVWGDQLFDSLCNLPNLQSLRLGIGTCTHEFTLVARTKHSFPALRILNLTQFGGCHEVVRFEEGSMAKLELLQMQFYGNSWRIVGIENLKNLREVKFSGYKSNSSMEHAVQQLKQKNENLSKPNQIKVVVKYQ